MSSQGAGEGVTTPFFFSSILALNFFEAAIKAYIHRCEFMVLWKVESEEYLEEKSSLCMRELLHFTES